MDRGPERGSIDLYAINLKRWMCLTERTLTRLKLSEQAGSSKGGWCSFCWSIPAWRDADVRLLGRQ
ncbi:MAG: hypothetical protein PHN90_05630 [Methanothrix sp.]|nr:hypothetical protein [Methanothrix sp.]